MTERNLLPVGFYDSYGDKAKQIYRVTSQIIDYLLENDFELFVPSPVEYEAVSSSSKDQKFRVLDPLSDQILTIRSDITSQASRALNYTDSDLVRICYSGVVLRLNIDKTNQARSLKQTGFEIMSKDSDLDIEKLAIEHLPSLINKMKLGSYSLVFSDISTQGLLAKLCQIPEAELSDLIAKNDFDGICNSSKNSDLRSILSPKRIDFFKDKEYLDYDSDFVNYYDAIARIINKMPESLYDSFIFDPLNFSFSNYNCGSFFTIIHNKTGKVIVRGGEYEIRGWGKGYGASVYIEEIMA